MILSQPSTDPTVKYTLGKKEVDDDDDFISFLHHSGQLCDSSTFCWLKNEDEVCVSHHDILCVTPEPTRQEERVLLRFDKDV